jgi:hypothetical protein
MKLRPAKSDTSTGEKQVRHLSCLGTERVRHLRLEAEIVARVNDDVLEAKIARAGAID